MSTASVTANAESTPTKGIKNGTLGMWIFLASEIMIFAGLIGSYVVLRFNNPDEFHPDKLVDLYHAKLNVPLATVNTLFLIISSLTMAFAVQAAWDGKNSKLRGWLLVTGLLGCLFCGMKYIEYGQKLNHVESVALEKLEEGTELAQALGTFPKGTVLNEETLELALESEVEKVDVVHPIKPSTSIFFSCYYTITGLHVVHVICGVIPIFWFALFGGHGRYAAPGDMTIECLGLYWHFVDIVWIFLFPLLYLIK
tara:strand:- start:289 stop:1050 length:762 start_codon:yes stop_codon:yes gene_type:complete